MTCIFKFARSGAFVFLLAPTICGANHDLTRLEVTLLVRASSAHQVAKIRERIRSIRQLRQACEYELASESLPAHCYQLLVFENRDQLISHQEIEKNQRVLDELCERRVAAETRLEHLDRIRPVQGISKNCLTAVDRRIGDLEYMTVLNQPKKVFQRRLKTPLKTTPET